MRTESRIREEAAKCDLKCIECHVKVSRSRRRNLIPRRRLEQKKLDIVNKIKEKGCEKCKHKDPTLPEFFHMDHLVPKDKIKSISQMVKNSKYSIDILKEECKKTRVLCANCHAIHTNHQIKSGIIAAKIRLNKELQNKEANEQI